MNVINFKYKNLGLFFILLLSFSCDRQADKEEENTYQIISYLMNDLSEDMTKIIPVFPPPPNGANYTFTQKDSLRIYKNAYEKNLERKVIGIKSSMFSNYKEEANLSRCDVDKSLTDRFMSFRKEQKIDLNKISLLKKDAVLYYNTVKNNMGRVFEDIDVLFNFSRIVFNKNYTKALLIVGVSNDILSGSSILFYLEKKNYHWEVICGKSLEIS